MSWSGSTTSDRRRRGAIVGLGNMAVRGHLPGWLRRGDVQIVAATDARAEQRTVLGSLAPEARWHATIGEVLRAERLDFVDICTPPSSHGPLIEAALEGGLHVLCEKPLVGSLAELSHLVEVAAARGCVVHTVHNWHHAPIIRRTTEMIRAGAIGAVRGVEWRTLRTGPAGTSDQRGNGNWRIDPSIAGGGILSDHGWHVFYVVPSWVGEAPQWISARLERRRHHGWDVEDSATVHVGFPSATAEIELTWASNERRSWAEVRGTGGILELQDDVLVLRRDGRAEGRWSCPPAMSAGSHHPEWFDHVADGFLRAMAGQAPRVDNVAEAQLCLALERQARRSSQEGGRRLPVWTTES